MRKNTKYLVIILHRNKMTNLFEVSDEQKIEIFELHAMDEEKLRRDKEILRKWYKKQPHLPREILEQDIVFEKTLLNSKFCVERAKKLIDNHYTLRGFNRDLYLPFKNGTYVPLLESCITFVPMPKLGSLNERLLIMELNDFDPKSYKYQMTTQSYLIMCELSKLFNFSNGYRVICNCNGFNADHAKSLDFLHLPKFYRLIMDSYSDRLHGLHLINSTPVAATLIKVAKAFAKHKMLQRIYVHTSLEDIHKLVPLSCLPKEYGGSLQISMSELINKYNELFLQNLNHFKQLPDLISDESLRIGESKHEDGAYGFDGTFKMLDID